MAAAAAAAAAAKGSRLLSRDVAALLCSVHSSHAAASTGPGDDLWGRLDQRETWDHFYTEGKAAKTLGHFDWFFSYKDVAQLFLPLLRTLPPGPVRILDVGCGTSALGLGLYRDCPRQLHVSCLDFSPPAIECLRRLLQASPPPGHPLSELCCHVGEATQLTNSFAQGSFHLVLDKGTCDSLLKGGPGLSKARCLVTECLRVLRPEGQLLQFSDEDPDARVPFLEAAGGARVSVREIASRNGISYYAYMLCREATEPLEMGGQPNKRTRLLDGNWGGEKS